MKIKITVIFICILTLCHYNIMYCNAKEVKADWHYVIAKEAVVIRSGPGTEYERHDILYPGDITIMSIYEDNSGWAYSPGGMVDNYIYSKYLYIMPEKKVNRYDEDFGHIVEFTEIDWDSVDLK